jgi:hypothetical protein
MKRREFLLTMSAVGLTAPSRLWAQTGEADVVRQLEALGYNDIRISRTFLGRVRITAKGPLGEREIILNPSNGAVLRDYIDREDDDDDDGGKGRGRGRGGDDDDDDDKDDDTDNSGSGGGSDDDDDDDD